jgi:hypothetical protein
MVVGQSRYFTLQPSGVADITSYSASYKLVKKGIVLGEGDVTNTGTKFDIRFQTEDLEAGDYELRIYITDPLDGFVQVFREKINIED